MEAAAKAVQIALKDVGCTHTELCPTKGYPIVYAEKMIDPKLPTVLVYGHYDVQPPDPLDQNIKEAFGDSDLCNNSEALQKAMREEVKCCILCKQAGKSLADSLYTVNEGRPGNANSHIRTKHKEHHKKAKEEAIRASGEKRKNETNASPKKRKKSALASQKAPSDESKEDECKRQADIIKQQADVIKIQEEEITRLSADIERYKKALAAFT